MVRKKRWHEAIHDKHNICRQALTSIRPGYVVEQIKETYVKESFLFAYHSKRPADISQYCEQLPGDDTRHAFFRASQDASHIDTDHVIKLRAQWAVFVKQLF